MFASCNNASETNTTAATATDTTTSVAMPHSMDTATTTGGLMQPMTSMMAGMKAVQITGDFDVDYANMMIAHHQGALDMAQAELAQGADAGLKTIAQGIISKQKNEQDQLKNILANYKAHGMKHGEGALQKSIEGMGSKMTGMTMSGNVDKDFATMMMAHHEQGIAMDKLQVEHGMDSKLKQMAKKSISSQQTEIGQFKAWLAANP